MSDRFTRISVPLSRDEYAALFGAAEREYRHPRDQARAILRAVLLGDQAGPPLGPNEIVGSGGVVVDMSTLPAALAAMTQRAEAAERENEALRANIQAMAQDSLTWVPRSELEAAEAKLAARAEAAEERVLELKARVAELEEELDDCNGTLGYLDKQAMRGNYY